MSKQDEQAFLQQLMEAFRVEADEHIQALSSGLLEMEKGLEPAEQATLVETIFREAHSLKGAARSVNMRQIEMICQSLEDVFAIWKRQEVECNSEEFDILHSAVDFVSMLLSSPQAGTIAISDIIRRIEAVAEKNSGARKAMKSPQRAKEPAEKTEFHQAEAEPTPPAPEPQKPQTVQSETAKNAETQEPTLPTELSLQTTQRQGAASPAKLTMSETIRISSSRLDAILLQAEEMLAVKLAVEQHGSDLREVLGLFDAYRQGWDKISPELRGSRQILERSGERGLYAEDKGHRQFAQVLDFLEQNQIQLNVLEARLKALSTSVETSRRSVGGMITGLLDSVKEVLMLPFSSLLQLFPKLVRDLSREQGKKVDLVMKGSEVEIDRRILEELKDPLIHLVRNSVDHGLETPEERARHQKPPRGALTIASTQLDSSKIEICISDDGGGINLNKTKAAAVRNGLISERDAEQMDDQEASLLIFQSGISTSPIITDISGRGLGMAIVREKVEKLGGLISIDTAEHVGTTFRIVLPVTLATFRGVIVQAGGQSFVVPTTNVEQVLRIKPDIIKTVQNKTTISLDERAVALVRLSDVLELPDKETAHDRAEFLQIMLLGNAEKRIAFSIDKVLNEQEVLVKNLGKQLSRVRNIAGATVLGSGEVIPILNVADLMKSAVHVSGVPLKVDMDRKTEDSAKKSILLVEDSVTSRMLLKGILEAANYTVSTAVDGVEGFTMLRTEPFDLVVSDIEMPRMDGFDLTAKIRSDQQLAELPVVLVTSLEAREHRERGVEVGANAYIVKSSLEQSNLLEVVQRLI